MIKGKSILAVIPARAGSKSIPQKNIRYLLGKPLIAWTIEEAKKSKYIDKLILSSENKKIIEISKIYGCEVPFIRPSELAQDDTPGIAPIKHAIKFYVNTKFDYIICLQCTSPLRMVKDIDNAIELCIESNTNSLVSVCEVKHHPYWMKTIDKNGHLSNLIDGDVEYFRRQDLPKIYRLNGAFYMATPDIILGTNSWFTPNTKFFIMNEISSIDIDSELDFLFAEFLLKNSANLPIK